MVMFWFTKPSLGEACTSKAFSSGSSGTLRRGPQSCVGTSHATTKGRPVKMGGAVGLSSVAHATANTRASLVAGLRPAHMLGAAGRQCHLPDTSSGTEERVGESKWSLPQGRHLGQGKVCALKYNPESLHASVGYRNYPWMICSSQDVESSVEMMDIWIRN